MSEVNKCDELGRITINEFFETQLMAENAAKATTNTSSMSSSSVAINQGRLFAPPVSTEERENPSFSNL